MRCVMAQAAAQYEVDLERVSFKGALDAVRQYSNPIGQARNRKLRRIIGAQMHEATALWEQTGRPARVFSEFPYQTKKTKKGGWDCARRVVAKAEHIDGKENPRFVVTSLASEAWAAQALYEKLYCARGDIENRIKEQFSLFADRVSTETMRAAERWRTPPPLSPLSCVRMVD